MLVDLVLKLFYKDFVQEMSIEQSARPLTELRIAAAAKPRPKPPAVLSTELSPRLVLPARPARSRFYCSARAAAQLYSHFAVCWKAEQALLCCYWVLNTTARSAPIRIYFPGRVEKFLRPIIDLDGRLWDWRYKMRKSGSPRSLESLHGFCPAKKTSLHSSTVKRSSSSVFVLLFSRENVAGSGSFGWLLSI